MQRDLREFDADVFIQWYIDETKAGRMPEERIKDPNWGVSTEFILSAAYEFSQSRTGTNCHANLVFDGIFIGWILFVKWRQS